MQLSFASYIMKVGIEFLNGRVQFWLNRKQLPWCSIKSNEQKLIIVYSDKASPERKGEHVMHSRFSCLLYNSTLVFTCWKQKYLLLVISAWTHCTKQLPFVSCWSSACGSSAEEEWTFIGSRINKSSWKGDLIHFGSIPPRAMGSLFGCASIPHRPLLAQATLSSKLWFRCQGWADEDKAYVSFWRDSRMCIS